MNNTATAITTMIATTATATANITSIHTTLSPASGSSCTVSKPLETTFQIVLYCIIIIMSLIGNLIVITVVIKCKRMHSVTNCLICNMAIADLLITLLPMIWEVLTRMYFKGVWPMGLFMCKFTYMCIYLSVACTILTLSTIATDRFLAIMFPMKKIITKCTLVPLLIFIWLASFAFSSPTIHAQRLWKDLSTGKKYCVEIWEEPFDAIESPKHYTIILFVGLYVIPLLLMATMYVCLIGVKLWRRKLPGEQTTETELMALKQKKKISKMLVTVVFVFAICWLPVFTLQFYVSFDPFYKNCPRSLPSWFPFLAFFMQYFNSGLNPYIYFIFSETYRRGFLQVFHRCLRSRRRVHTHTEMTSAGQSKVESSPYTVSKYRRTEKTSINIKLERTKIYANCSPATTESDDSRYDSNNNNNNRQKKT